jgi:hypothetical protein
MTKSAAIQTGFFEYRELSWGDLIYATKETLQAMGVGVGLAFPGEAGGPKRELTTTDPRGFKCKITEGRFRGPDVFCASIHFPDRERPDALGGWQSFAPGVERKVRHWTDDFAGTADDLVAANLVPPGHFPGCPGMRKTTVTILPDGSIPIGAPNKNHPDSQNPGAKRIRRVSKTKYCVELYIDKDLGRLRLEAERQADAEWGKEIDALPRPPRIDGRPTQTISNAQKDYQPDSVATWKSAQMFGFSVLRCIAEDDPCAESMNSLYKYDAISRVRILAKLDELERAIQGGAVIHKSTPEQPINGNVISISRNSCPKTDNNWI